MEHPELFNDTIPNIPGGYKLDYTDIKILVTV
jgi:hypothetical protein